MQLDAFLALTGANAVTGESTDTTNSTTIEILQFSLDMARATNSTVEAFPLKIIKPIDAASPALARMATTQSTIGTATLSICQPASSPTAAAAAARVVIYQIILTNVWISRMTVVGAAPMFPMSCGDNWHRDEALWVSPQLAGQGPLELVELAYGQVQWNYKGGAGTGTGTATYKLPSRGAY